MTKKAIIIQKIVFEGTNGLVTLSEKVLMDIIEALEGRHCFAKLFRYSDMLSSWQFIRTISLTVNDLAKALHTATHEKPPSQEGSFYKYECYNSEGQFETIVYSLNPDFFTND